MTTLTLSGWTQPADALNTALGLDAAIFDYSAYGTVEESFEALRPYAGVENIIGWSLGGQLALRAVAAGVLAPKHLTLIAPAYQFVQKETGMDPMIFTQFRENYATDTTRTMERFHALIAKGDREMRRVIDKLGHHPQVDDTARWLPWLDDLGATSLRDLDLSMLPPTLLIHGDADAIVPLVQAETLAAHAPKITLECWEGVAHAPHLHDAARLNASIANHRSAA